MSSTTAVKEVFNKTQLLNALAVDTGLSKKDVASVLDALSNVISRHVKKLAVGHFVLPGMLKIKTVKVAARKQRKECQIHLSRVSSWMLKPVPRV